MNRLITTILGGRPFSQNDQGFMQDCTFEGFKGLLTGLGLGNETFILSGCAISYSSGNMQVQSGYMSFKGEICPVPSQSVTGVNDITKYWFVKNTTSGHPVLFKNGQLNNIYEYHSIELVYSDSQPSGSINAASVVAWTTTLYNSVVKNNIPTKLSQLAERSYDDLNDKPTIYSRLQDLTERSYDSLTDKPVMVPEWINATMNEGFETYKVRYRKDILGNVMLEIPDINLANELVGETVYLLPAGYRPKEQLMQMGWSDGTNEAKIGIIVRTSGVIDAYGFNSGAVFYYAGY